MIYRLSGFARTEYTRPSDEVPPEYKETPEYAKEWAQFIYSRYLAGETCITPDEQENIKLNREYAAGRQDPEIYKSRVLLERKQPPITTDEDSEYTSILKQREGFINVNFEDILSPIPKILLNIQGLMEDTEHNISVYAIDEKSTTLKQELKYRSLFEGQNRPVKQYIQQTMDMPQDVQEKALPSSMEELDLWEKIGSFKLAYESAMKDGIDYTEKLSKNPKVKRAVIADLITNGKALVYVYNDIGGVAKWKYADFADLVMEGSMEEDNSDSSFGGLQQWMTVADVRAELAAEDMNVSEDDIKSLAERWGSFNDNKVSYGTERKRSSFPYDNIRVPVMLNYWKTVNTSFKTYHVDGKVYNENWRKKENGRYRLPRAYDTEYRNTKREDLRTLYSTKWIIGSDIVWKYGQVKDIPFDYHDKDVKLPFMLFKIPGKSIVEAMRPIEDEIVLTYLDLQNARAQSAPTGLKIEISSITNIPMGKGKVMHPLDVLTIYQQTGRLLYRLAPPEPSNPIGSQNPVDTLLGGYDASIISAVKSLELYYRELERITGISDFSTGRSPVSEQGLGVTQIALATTNNTLRPIYTGYITIKENAAKYAAIKIQSVIINAKGEECPYYNILGPAKFNAIKSAGGFPPVYWGIEISAKLDSLTKQAILEAARSALAVGKDGVPILTYSEYIFIVEKINTSENLADVRAWIQYKEQQAEIRSFQRAQATQTMIGEQTRATNEQKAQEEIAKTAIEAKKSKEEKELDHRLETETKLLDHFLKIKLLEAEGKAIKKEEPEIGKTRAERAGINQPVLPAGGTEELMPVAQTQPT